MVLRQKGNEIGMKKGEREKGREKIER